MTTVEHPLIIFLHIPKTGGLTLRHFLLRQYRGGAAFDHYDEWMRPIDQQSRMNPPAEGQNGRFLEDFWSLPPDRQARVRVCTGHFSFGIHEHLPAPNTYITMLREPIDRTLSGYHYRRTLRLPDLSLREYVGDPGGVPDPQTRRVAGGEWARGSSDTRGMLDAAKENLSAHFDMVGITERWDETLLMLALKFGWPRPYYHRYNESHGRVTRDEVDEDLLEILKERTQIDRELYLFARAEFEDRLAREYPNIEHEVARLRRGNRVWRHVDRPLQGARRVRYLARSSAARTFHRVRGN